MSFYHYIFGPPNPDTSNILDKIGLSIGDIPRLRDVNTTDSHEIAVYARLGGGNREHDPDTGFEAGLACPCFGCWITYAAPKLKYFLRSVDDEFDSTYCTIYFGYPPEHDEWLRSSEGGEWNPDKRWKVALDAIKSDGLTASQERTLGPIIDVLKTIIEDSEDESDGPGDYVLKV